MKSLVPDTNRIIAGSRPRDVKAAWFTCDVFDTVITRAVPRPSDVFDAVAERLGLGNEADRASFAACRVESEAGLRRGLRTGTDLQLCHIYEEVLRRIPAHIARGMSVASAVAAELESELDLCRPWPPGIRLLKEWRGRAQFAGFVSDMYLPADAIQRMLERASAWTPGDRLFVSGEAGATKASGRLFEIVASTVGLDPARWTHLGDNDHSDRAVPEKLGIRAMQVRTPVTTPRTLRIFAGDRRRLRIAAVLSQAAGDIPAGLDAHQQAVWRIGAHVLAPTALWFADTVLRTARSDGRRNLWFLARDGQIIYKAALIANRSIGYSGGLHYVMASRQALHLPSLFDFDDEAKRWLLANPDVATPEDVAQRAALSPADSKAWLNAVRESRDASAPMAEAAESIWSILSSAPHRQRVVDSGSTRRRAAVAYFESISDFRDLGIVDIGWNGNLQCALQRVIGSEEVIGYYIGLFGRNKEVSAASVRPCLFNFAKTTPWAWAPGVSVLECLLAGTHPGVAEYAWDESGQARALLQSEESWESQGSWGVETLHNAAELAMNRLAEEGLMPGSSDVSELLLSLIHKPEQAEAATIGVWPVQNLQNRTATQHLATPKHCRDLLFKHRAGERVLPSLWPGGEAALTGRHRYEIFRLLRKVVGFADRFTQRFHAFPVKVFPEQ